MYYPQQLCLVVVCGLLATDDGVLYSPQIETCSAVTAVVAPTGPGGHVGAYARRSVRRSLVVGPMLPIGAPWPLHFVDRKFE